LDDCVEVVCVAEALAAPCDELTLVEVPVLDEGDEVADVLSSDDEEGEEVSVTTVLDVIDDTTVDVASVVVAVVLVTGGVVVPLELDPACLFANSTKLLATSGVSL